MPTENDLIYQVNSLAYKEKFILRGIVFNAITSRDFNLNVFTVLKQQSSRVASEVKHEHITLTLNLKWTPYK